MMDNFDVDDVVDIVASDEKLFRYVMKLVKSRLSKGARADKDWCVKVIDMTIEAALQEVRVTDIVKNMIRQQQQQAEEARQLMQEESDDDDILLPQPSSDSSEDGRGAIAPFEPEFEQPQQSNPPRLSPHRSDNRPPASEPSDLQDSSHLSESNLNDSELRPQFSDNEPSSVSTTSPKRVLRNMNKYKSLPSSDHPAPSEEIEPFATLEIETHNLPGQHFADFHGQSDLLDTNASVGSCAESDASTVQVMAPAAFSPVHDGDHDWEDDGHVVDRRREDARRSLEYHSDNSSLEDDPDDPQDPDDQVNNDADDDGLDVLEKRFVASGNGFGQTLHRQRYTEDEPNTTSSMMSEEEPPITSGIQSQRESHEFLVSPTVATHGGVEDGDEVLMTDSNRQSQDFPTDRTNSSSPRPLDSSSSSSSSEEQRSQRSIADDDDGDEQYRRPRYDEDDDDDDNGVLENIDEDLAQWEAKLMTTLKEEREELQQQPAASAAPAPAVGVFSMATSLPTISIDVSRPVDPTSSNSAPHSPRSASANSSTMGSPSTASPNRLKTCVPNRNILPHQASPSSPGVYLSPSRLPTAGSSSSRSSSSSSSPHSSPSHRQRHESPHRSPQETETTPTTMPMHAGHSEPSEDYSMDDFHADQSLLSANASPHKKPFTNDAHAKDAEEEVDEVYDDDDYYYDAAADRTAAHSTSTTAAATAVAAAENPFGFAHTASSSSSSSGPRGGGNGRTTRRVMFHDQLISDVFYRDRTEPSEKRLLFYAHEDEARFGEDQFREMSEAEKLGLSWAEWVEKYHHDHDDGLRHYRPPGSRPTHSNSNSYHTSQSHSQSHSGHSSNTRMDLYTSGDDEFEMAEEDSDGGLYDFDDDNF